jgi:hypothetical protein
MGHVFSVCPNRKKHYVRKDSSPEKKRDSVQSTSESMGSQNTCEKLDANADIKIGSGVGISFKSSTAYPHRIPKSNNVQFTANQSKPVHNSADKRVSGGMGNDKRIPQRFSTPPRNESFKGVSPRNNFSSGSGPVQNPSRYSPPHLRNQQSVENRFNDNRNHHYYDRFQSRINYGPHSPRPSPPRGFQSPPMSRPSVNNSVSKAPARGDGYWTEIILRDENGTPKPMKAWVPYGN